MVPRGKRNPYAIHTIRRRQEPNFFPPIHAELVVQATNPVLPWPALPRMHLDSWPVSNPPSASTFNFSLISVQELAIVL